MLQELQDADTLTVVSFNTIATVLLDHQRKSANTLIEQSIQNYFQQYGETNFEAAMNVAFGVCQKKVNPVKKIIFLTDGNPWGGNTNNALSIASRIANEGLATLDEMGIGGDFNFDLMRQFSAPSGGITETSSTRTMRTTCSGRFAFQPAYDSEQHSNCKCFLAHMCGMWKFISRLPRNAPLCRNPPRRLTARFTNCF